MRRRREQAGIMDQWAERGLARAWVAVMTLALTGLAIAQGQEGPSALPTAYTDVEPEEEFASVASIEARISRIDSQTDLDAETRRQLTDLYKQALEQAKAAVEWEGKLVEYQRARLTTQERLDQIKSELAKAAPEGGPTLPAQVTVAELEQGLAQKEAEWEAAQKVLKEVQDRAELRNARRKEGPARIVEIRQQLDELIPALDVAQTTDRRTAVTAAERTLAYAKRRALESEWSCIEEELSCYQAREPEWTARADLTSREIAELEREIAGWREQVNERRKRDAELAAEAARIAQREASAKHPVAAKAAQVNADLAKERSELAEELAQADSRLAEVSRLLSSQDENFKKIGELISRVGLTPTLAIRVRQELEGLPSTSALKRNIRRRQGEFSSAFFRDDELQGTRQHLQSGLELEMQGVREALAADAALSSEQSKDIENTVGDLLQSRLSLLGDLSRDYGRYKELLIKLDVAESDLIRSTAGYARFLSERVLWIRSTESLSWRTLAKAWNGCKAFFSKERWGEVWTALSVDFHDHPVALGSAVAALVILLVLHPPLLAEIKRCNEEVTKATLQTYAPTFRAFVTTLLLAASWALPAWLLAWRLLTPLDSGDFVKGVGLGLQVAGSSLFFIGSLSYLSRPGGLADAHFGWSPHANRVVRVNLRWFGLLVVPAIFVLTILDAQAVEDVNRESFSHLVFQIWGISALVFIYRVFRPDRGAFVELIRGNSNGWVARFKWFWFPMALLLPVTLVVASLLGYHYTALQLGWRLRQTGFLVVGMFVFQGMLERWVLSAKRRLAILQFRKWRAAQAEKKDAASSAGGEGEGSPAPSEPIDLPTVSAQTRQLLRAGLVTVLVIGIWGTWVDVLPALNRLDDIHLWAVSAPLQGTQANSGALADAPTSLSKPQPRFVSLADLAQALVTLMLTIIAGKNIPGLLEISVLNWGSWQAGSRYAFTTISRYVITVVGLVMAFGMVGISWSTVQWLAAAITVGLGFGLQEIFANFVAGLILLFERPIRLGDTVTVGSTTGKVSRIRIRATTIIDWDRKELIIPNKEFVTGSVVNWSLTDRSIRLVFKVGVAYGSDTELVTKLLQQVARGQSRLHTDPPPRVVFAGFGDNGLDFELHIYLVNVDDMWIVRHEMNSAIERVLREAGIQIPYPQRDMHIKSVTVVPDVVVPPTIVGGVHTSQHATQ